MYFIYRMSLMVAVEYWKPVYTLIAVKVDKDKIHLSKMQY